MTENNTPYVSVTMSFTEWCKKYQPITVVISEEYGSTRTIFETPDGAMYYANANEDCIWSFGNDDGEDGGWIINGVWSVNFLGYYATKIPCEPNFSVFVKLDFTPDYS